MTRALSSQAPTFRRSDLRLSLMAGGAMAALVLAMPVSLAAQQLPQEFSLPSPSPTPTPAPQGPVDERAGVQIRPRVIPEEGATPPASRPTPAPSPTTAPARTPPTRATQTPVPSPSPSQTPTGSRPSQSGEPQRTASEVPTRQPDVQNQNAQGAEIPVEDETAPGFETFDETEAATPPVGPDGWYDVDDLGSEGQTGDAVGAPAGTISASGDSSIFGPLADNSGWLAALLAVLVAILGAVGWLLWRRKKEQPLALAAPSTPLTTGVRKTMGDPAASKYRSASAQSDDAVDPVVARQDDDIAAAEPARIDLGLSITSGSRSLMRFTLEFTLEIFNRSDFAVRDLNVAAKLACAQRGGQNAAPVAGAQPVGEIDRIGPHQCRRVTGTLQLPVDQITPISQGGKPVLIPLLHFVIDAQGQPPLARSFVIGTPSAASAGRVHPLLLEGPPGGYPRLRAQAIKQPEVGPDSGEATPSKSPEPA